MNKSEAVYYDMIASRQEHQRRRIKLAINYHRPGAPATENQTLLRRATQQRRIVSR